jgi:hypothetical protein
MVCEPGLFRTRTWAEAYTPQIMWGGGTGKPDAAGVSETGRPPHVCIAISGPGSVGFSGATVRQGICLFCRSDITEVPRVCVGVPDRVA